MPTKQQRDQGLETVNKREAITLVTNALGHFLASQELQDVIDARVKAQVTLETAKWGGLFGEGAADPYPDYDPKLPESSL